MNATPKLNLSYLASFIYNELVPYASQTCPQCTAPNMGKRTQIRRFAHIRVFLPNPYLGEGTLSTT